MTSIRKHLDFQIRRHLARLEQCNLHISFCIHVRPPRLYIQYMYAVYISYLNLSRTEIQLHNHPRAFAISPGPLNFVRLFIRRSPQRLPKGSRSTQIAKIMLMNRRLALSLSNLFSLSRLTHSEISRVTHTEYIEVKRENYIC